MTENEASAVKQEEAPQQEKGSAGNGSIPERYHEYGEPAHQSEQTEQQQQPLNTPRTPKYSVVLRFWNVPQELEVVDIVSCQNRFTKANFVKFIDTDGRLWDNVPQDDVILITNYPGKDDMEDFMRLKRETVELNKLIASNKPDMDDVSIR